MSKGKKPSPRHEESELIKMAKRKEIIKIGEENFIIENKEVKNCFCWADFPTLFECYERPSYSKEGIYNKYKNMLYNNCEDVIYYGVKSYNTFVVNLHAVIRINGVMYYAFITPSYNRLYRLESEA